MCDQDGLFGVSKSGDATECNRPIISVERVFVPLPHSYFIYIGFFVCLFFVWILNKESPETP